MRRDTPASVCSSLMLVIRKAEPRDVPQILQFIRELAEYEKEPHAVVATEEDLFVRPRLRGKGIGKALLVELARIAVQEKCGRLDWQVLEWNTPAVDFYRALGARMLTEWETFRLAGDALERLARDG